MQAYQTAFRQHEMRSAQLLLTKAGIDQPEHRQLILQDIQAL